MILILKHLIVKHLLLLLVVSSKLSNKLNSLQDLKKLNKHTLEMEPSRDAKDLIESLLKILTIMLFTIIGNAVLAATHNIIRVDKIQYWNSVLQELKLIANILLKIKINVVNVAEVVVTFSIMIIINIAMTIAHLLVLTLMEFMITQILKIIMTPVLKLDVFILTNLILMP